MAHTDDLKRVAKEFGSDEARSEYLRKHPQADPKNHTVKGKDPAEGYDPYGKAWKDKRENRIKKETEDEDRKIQKERELADKKPDRDKKKKEKYDRDEAKRNKQLDEQDAEKSKKPKSEKDTKAQALQDAIKKDLDSRKAALLVARVATRFAMEHGAKAR